MMAWYWWVLISAVAYFPIGFVLCLINDRLFRKSNPKIHLVVNIIFAPIILVVFFYVLYRSVKAGLGTRYLPMRMKTEWPPEPDSPDRPA